MPEATRPRFHRAMALGGALLWLCYPVTYWLGIGARHDARCAGRSFTGSFDSCFNDALPIVELAWTVIAWLLTPLFLFLAWHLWRSALDPRPGNGRTWAMAISIAGMAWTTWNIATAPFSAANLPLDAYWLCFAAWFAMPLVMIASARSCRPS